MIFIREINPLSAQGKTSSNPGHPDMATPRYQTKIEYK